MVGAKIKDQQGLMKDRVREGERYSEKKTGTDWEKEAELDKTRVRWGKVREGLSESGTG